MWKINECCCEEDSVMTDGLPVRHYLSPYSSRQISTVIHEFLFVTAGVVVIHSDVYNDTRVESGHILFLPAGNIFEISSETHSSLLLVFVEDKREFENHFCPERLYQTVQSDPVRNGILPMNDKIWHWLSDVATYRNEGINYTGLFRAKTFELFYLLKAYYSDRELARFFRPVLSGDHTFADFVFQNWKKVKSVKQLAELSNYSEKGFGRKFKQVFGIPSSTWLHQKRAAAIRHDLYTEDKPLKELAEKHLFSTPQQFNEFCVRYLGKPPGEIIASYKKP